MRYLRKNTATRVTVGPFLDKTDAITPETGLTATNEKLTFVVDDAGVPTLVLDTTATGSGGANDLVHVANDDAGYYDLELAAANVNYVGRAMLSINYLTDHLPVFHEFEILPEVEYDAIHGLGGQPQPSVIAVEVPYGAASVLRFPLTGVVGSPSFAAGDGTITQDDGTGTDSTDNNPAVEGNTVVWTISAAEAATPSANGPYRTFKFIDQSSPKLWTDLHVVIVTTDHPSACKPNGVQLSILGHASDQTTTSIRLGVDPVVAIRKGWWGVVTAGTGAGQGFYVETYSNANPYVVTPNVALETALDDTSRILFYADARAALRSLDSTTVNTAVAAALATYDPPTKAELDAAVDPLPTNAELATALGTADDATLAAIAALNNLSAAAAQTAAADALTAAGITAAGGVTKIKGVSLTLAGTGGQGFGA